MSLFLDTIVFIVLFILCYYLWAASATTTRHTAKYGLLLSMGGIGLVDEWTDRKSVV